MQETGASAVVGPVLVTGRSGFVGAHCARHLPAVDLADANGPVDLRNVSRLRHALATLQPRAVIHLAAQSSVAASLQDPRATYEINFLGVLNLLESLRDAGFRGRMLYVGSADSYGAVPETGLPIQESTPLRPLNPYAVSKAAAESLCYQWSQSGPFEIVIARPFNHIGPGQGVQFAIADFASQVAACRASGRRGRLHVGDLDTTRDFTDVRDIVRAYAALLESGRNGEAYNVCSGTERSVRDVLDALLRIAGVTMDIEVETHRLRPVQQRRTFGSHDKLHADTGWRPAIPFEQTLRDTLDYWERKQKA